jgi:hypothetical protein
MPPGKCSGESAQKNGRVSRNQKIDLSEKYRSQQALSSGKARIGIGDDLTSTLPSV